ncbi:RNA-directed DNA polymerase, eukaryota [Tanacetum coccineum]
MIYIPFGTPFLRETPFDALRLTYQNSNHEIKIDTQCHGVGDWVVDPILVKKEFRDHFADRFQDPGPRKGRINFQFPNRLSSEQVADLETRISTDEIRSAVWGCGVDKSPGPDGFTFDFFRKYWTVVGTDFCSAVLWFFDHGEFAIGCNSSFVALIPKILDPKRVCDYRPISLIGCLYKVVTKILASRLSTVISDLISDVQSAFLPNRQILDGPFIINEVLARCKVKKQQAMIFKVDFAKAYDSIRWDFLEDVLTSFGFGPQWCSWTRKLKWKAFSDLSFNRAVKLTRGGPEAQQLEQLTNLLDSVSLSNMEDRCFWDLNGEGVFQVKDVRSVLDETFLPKENIPTRWVKSIPIKVMSSFGKLVHVCKVVVGGRMEHGFLSQKGIGGMRGVKEKSSNALNIEWRPCATAPIAHPSETSLEVVKDGVVPSVTGDSGNPAMEVELPTVVDETVVKEKQCPVINTTGLGSYPPLPTQAISSAGNAPGKSSYANVTGNPSGKKLNIRTLFTPGGNGIDVVAYPVVANYVRNTWGKYGLVRSMFSSSTELFSFQFSSMDGLDTMLENGPWFNRNNPLILKKWHPDENLLKEDVST